MKYTVFLTQQQADALDAGIKFYGSAGHLAHKVEHRLAPFPPGKLEALNGLTAQQIVIAGYFYYDIKGV
jgi:hypothetical protein